MYVYIHIYVCIRTYAYIYICMFTYICIYVYMYVYVHMHICVRATYVHMHAYDIFATCMYTCMYTYICIHVFVPPFGAYVHMYTRAHTKYMHTYLSITLFICLCIQLSVCLSICVSISTTLFLFLSVYLSICLTISIYVFIYLFVYVSHLCDMMHSYVWHDASICATRRINMRRGHFCKRALQKRRYSAKMTYNFIEPTNRSHPIPRSASWLVHLCDVTHSYHSFIWAVWRICTCDMTHWFYAWDALGSDVLCRALRHDSFICATWLIHMTPSVITPSYVQHDSFI